MEIKTLKGFKDILPQEATTWQRVELIARNIFQAFGFREIRLPLLERTELFSRSIGQDTDIVSKEMYTIEDSKGKGLTLRPEATASVVRAYIQHGLYRDYPVQKLFLIGPMFRRERPQKGRFRQFHQINAEVFGDDGPRSDADLINMAMHLLEKLGLAGAILNINSLGCTVCRTSFREELKGYLSQRVESLCGDCKKRAEVNPLRVFDCKVEQCRQVVSEAPSILDFICKECRDHFSRLQDYLKSLHIDYVVNHTLVRGLDYYSRTAFEILSDKLGSQNAIAGGGRYDGLVKQLGGPDHSGIGFAAGVERLVTLLEEDGMAGNENIPEIFIAGLGERAEKITFVWINEFRRSGIHAEMEYGSKGLKALMKKADKLGAKMTLIVGDDELAAGMGILRDMKSKVQQEIELDNLVENFKKRVYL